MSALFPATTLAFLLGLLLADWGWVGPSVARAVAMAAWAAGVCLCRRMGWVCAATLLVACACGALRLGERLEQAGLDLPDGPRDTVVEGTVCASVRRAASQAIDLCHCIEPSESGGTIPRRLRVFAGVDAQAVRVLSELRPGERIRAQLRLMPLRRASNPGARDSAVRLRRKGIGARATLRNAALVVRIDSRVPFHRQVVLASMAGFEDWRAEIGERLAARGPGGGLIRALVLGDRAALGEAPRAAFRVLGITHLLAVSGLHVALVAGFAYALARRVALRGRWATRVDARRPALLCALLLALVYAAVSGLGIPVRRAMLFLVVLCLALMSGRTVRGTQILSLAALPLLVFEPHALFEMGAQLSFVASAALLLSRRPRNGDASGLHSLVRTSATAIAATAPLLAAHGGTVGVVGIVANLVAVPWIGMVFLPAALIAAILTALPETSLSLAFVAAVARLGDWTLLAVVEAAHWFPQQGVGGVPATWALVLSSAVALAALCVAGSTLRVVLCVAAGGLLSLAPSRAIDPAPPRVVMFEVGQGDAILVQGKRAAVLIDGGRAVPGGFDAGRRVVVPALSALGVTALDVVVATHADLDHRGGLEAVLEAVPARELWLPFGGAAQPDFARLISLAKARGITLRERGKGDAAERFGDLRLEPLWPDRGALPADRNDASLVVRAEVLQAGRVLGSVLLTGDLGVAAERDLVAAGVRLRASVLKVGHHGSDGSSAPAFLEAVGAPIALVSAPCHGSGGLPSASALDRLEAVAAEIWWTGRSGAIFVGFDPRDTSPSVRGWHSPASCQDHGPSARSGT